MAEVILICGKICCGKSTYAEALCAERNAVLLSVDELMLTLFGQDAGAAHDAYTAKIQAYLLEKAAELCAHGVTVLLDWGFWTAASRRNARAFFAARGIPVSLHVLTLSDAEWNARIRKRNAAVQSRQAQAYAVEEGLLKKCQALFEPPAPGEAEVTVPPSAGCAKGVPG